MIPKAKPERPATNAPEKVAVIKIARLRKDPSMCSLQKNSEQRLNGMTI